MIIFKTASDINTYLQKEKRTGKSIGFVPTMGALHSGHLSLIRSSKGASDITVCSIFVNPTQFNNPEDFKHYPIAIEKDIELLIKENCNILFLPPVIEIYPTGYQKRSYDLGTIETILEGAHRPDHFQGVCEVVHRLLEIINPDQLFLGQKDFQQCKVITRLLSILGKDKEIDLHIEPTLREANGLAMSSRNLRLTEKQREQATEIWKSLSRLRESYSNASIEELIKGETSALQTAGFTVDYIEIRSTSDLQHPIDKSQKAVALVAASLGPVRLIDNLLLN